MFLVLLMVDQIVVVMRALALITVMILVVIVCSVDVIGLVGR